MPKQTVIVGERVMRNFEFLNKLARSKSKKRIELMIRHATPDELLAIVEICSHILSADFSLTSKQIERLKPYAHFVRRLKRVRGDQGARRVIQEGSGLIAQKAARRYYRQKGGIGFLASVLIPVLVEAASSLLK